MTHFIFLSESNTPSDGSLIDPQNFRPPYKKGSLVDEFELTDDAVFVSAYDEYRTGSWMFSVEDFKSWGTDASRFKDVLALPSSPKSFALVKVP